MGPRFPAVLLALVCAIGAQAQLGAPRRVFETRYGVLPYLGVERSVTSDGTTFMVVLRTASTASDYDPLRQMVVITPDGKPLMAPLPVRERFGNTGWAGHYFLTSFYSGDRRYVRVSSDGQILDAMPRVAPFSGAMQRMGMSASRILVVDEHNDGWLIDRDGNAAKLHDVPPRLTLIVGNDTDFGITYMPNAVDRWVRTINERGETLRDELLPKGGWVTGDRASYLAVPDPYDYISPYRILGRDLAAVRIFELRAEHPSLDPIPGYGRGYLSTRYGPGYVTYSEFRPPSYYAESATVTSGSYDFYGNPRALLAVRGNETFVVSGVSKLAEFPPAIPFRGAMSVERPTAATNAAGVSLLVWSENGRVLASRVSRFGAAIDVAPLSIIEQCSDVRFSAASDGENFLVGWSGCADAGGAIVTSGGVITETFSRPRMALTNNHVASVIFDGEQYLFAWSDSTATRVSRVSRDGISARPAFIDAQSFTMAALPDGHVMSAYLNRNRTAVLSRRYTREMEPAGNETAVVAEQFWQPVSLARTGSRALLIMRSPSLRAYAVPLDSDGNAGARFATGELDARTFCTGDDCTLVWKHTAPWDKPAETSVLYGATVIDGAIGTPFVLHAWDVDYQRGEPILLRGSASNPSLLLFSAPDPEKGGLQVFARNALQKRRTSRP